MMDFQDGCDKHLATADCPCDLFIDIANANGIGNCNRLKSNGMSFGIKGIRGIKTSSLSSLRLCTPLSKL